MQPQRNRKFCQFNKDQYCTNLRCRNVLWVPKTKVETFLLEQWVNYSPHPTRVLGT